MTTLFENILCLRVSQDGRVGIRAQQRFLIGQWRSTKDQSAIEKKRERPETSETTKTKLLLRLRLSPALGLFANRTMNHSGSDSFLKKKKANKQTNEALQEAILSAFRRLRTRCTGRVKQSRAPYKT